MCAKLVVSLRGYFPIKKREEVRKREKIRIFSEKYMSVVVVCSYGVQIFVSLILIFYFVEEGHYE